LALDQLGTAAQVLIQRGGEPLADVTAGEGGTAETRFLLYSLSKGITALGVLRLADRGQVGLAHPLARHVPAFGQAGKSAVTVRQVLSHTGGFPDQGADPSRPHLQPADFGEWERARDLILSLPFQHRYAGQAVYHPTAFGALGILLEEVTGKPFREAIREEVLGPLGMSNTTFGLPPEVRPLAARPAGDAAAFWGPEIMEDSINPSANAWSNARDVARLFGMLRAGG